MSHLHNLAPFSTRENTVNICATLFWRLSSHGLTADEINRLVKDVFNLLRDGGSFTVAFVNYELQQLGWIRPVMDESSFELIIFLLENEFDYVVNTHVTH
ncbi:MAG: hypothetical protein KKD44_10550 [Proteobacteria bacterium]|nr:hypothetical protein [Pseudomonadota bacterium]